MKKMNSTLTQEQFALIDGLFTPEDAADVLLTMIRKKIDYHNARILSKWERFGEACPDSEARLKSLRKLREDIRQVVNEAEAAGKHIDLNCHIQMELIDPKTAG